LAGPVTNAFTNPFGPASALLPSWNGPSYGVYVDPFGLLPLPATTTIGFLPATTPGMLRRSISLTNCPAHAGLALNYQECGRWCALTDDLFWTNAATADTTAGSVRRGLGYTWAWHLRQQRAGDSTVIDANVIVYYRRDNSVPPGGREVAYAVSGGGVVGTNSLTISYPAGPPAQPPAVRTGRWILDTTQLLDTSVTPARPAAVPGYFYRVVDYQDQVSGPGTMQLELETPLKQTAQVIVVLEDVVEVFDKGPGRLP
jgi:hypothetical protein